MSINSVNGINGSQQIYGGQPIDQKERDVAQKLTKAGLIENEQKFYGLKDEDKQLLVQKYNELNPQDPIEDKKNSVQQSQDSRNVQPPQYPPGSEMSQFMGDVNWKKIKLQ